jgi:hypothetical protein
MRAMGEQNAHDVGIAIIIKSTMDLRNVSLILPRVVYADSLLRDAPALTPTQYYSSQRQRSKKIYISTLR